jgi:hypothetical protein
LNAPKTARFERIDYYSCGFGFHVGKERYGISGSREVSHPHGNFFVAHELALAKMEFS